MIASGMADYGYQYVNIDEGWIDQARRQDPGYAARREPDGSIRCPTNVFPI